MDIKSAIKTINHIKQQQNNKHDRSYRKTKLDNLKGFFFPPINKPPERKQIFFSRLKEQTKASRMASALVNPAPIIQIQVDARRKAPSIVKILA